MKTFHLNPRKNRQEKMAKSRSFFRTVLFSLFTVSILATIIPTVCLSIDYMRSSVKVATEFNHNLLSQTNYTIAQMNDSVSRLTKSLYNDPDIINFLYLKNQDSRAAILASRALDKQLVTLPFIESVYLYNASQDLFFSSRTGEQASSENFQDTEIAALATDLDFVASYDKIPISTKVGASGKMVSTVSYLAFDAISSGSEGSNAIIVNVSPTSLTKSIQSMNQYPHGVQTNFMVIDKEGNVISAILSPKLTKDPSFYPSLFSSIKEDKNQKQYLTVSGTHYLISETEDNVNGWYLISLIPVNVIFQDMISSTIFAVATTVVMLIFCFGACFYFARRLNTPVQAITRIMKGDKMDPLASGLGKTREFQTILSSFQYMQEQNKEFDRLKRETSYSVRKDYLNNLTTGNLTDSAESMGRKLLAFNLSYLLEDTLCMAVFKIDNYNRFCTENNPKELWVLRFAIVNIMEEISGQALTADVFSRDNDKFVILIDVKEELSYKAFCEKLEEVIHKIQVNISEYLHISMTAAYSTLFRDPDHIPSMYTNMKDSLLLQIKYGHGAVISPYMVDDMETSIYEFPHQDVEKLISSILSGSPGQTQELFRNISASLYLYDYNEILSGSIHLIYSIYTGVLQKYPSLKETGTSLLKKSLIALQSVELTTDIDQLMADYIQGLCQAVVSIQKMNTLQGNNIITTRICHIVEEQFSDLSLCLSSIAEEIGLTPNYIGKIFKASMQKSVAQYILELRMEKLGEYLNKSSLPLNTMLERVGIEKSNYFYTQFKKHFGMSLMDYKTKKGLTF